MMRTVMLALAIGGASAFAPAAVGGRAGTRMMASLGDFTATTNAGAEKKLSDYVGKPTFIANVASLWGTTVRDMHAMNDLVDKFGDKVNVLGFPCNQFGHQTNEGDEEFLNTLKYVRPGDGYEFKGELFSKTYVNGATAHPLFKWMKTSIPIPQDPGVTGDTKENGCDDVDALILPRGGFDTTTVTLWSPVCRSDIAWNFEKFLLDADGNIVKRYSRYYDIATIANDIEALLKVSV